MSTIDIPRSFTIGDVNVGVDIVHPQVGNLDAWLQSPQGTVVPLIFGESGQDFTGTVFDDEASQSVDQGSAPYTGHWKVDSFYAGASLSNFDGEDALGTWTLNVRDQAIGNTGYITGWSLSFTAGN
jgi:subtilisin-like proprotein convertase family protein